MSDDMSEAAYMDSIDDYRSHDPLFDIAASDNSFKPSRATLRTSRKRHLCDGDCGEWIEKGAQYNDARDARLKGQAFRYHLGCWP